MDRRGLKWEFTGEYEVFRRLTAVGAAAGLRSHEVQNEIVIVHRDRVGLFVGAVGFAGVQLHGECDDSTGGLGI